jgi:hypothetical protein
MEKSEGSYQSLRSMPRKPMINSKDDYDYDDDAWPINLEL